MAGEVEGECALEAARARGCKLPESEVPEPIGECGGGTHLLAETVWLRPVTYATLRASIKECALMVIASVDDVSCAH